MAKKKKALRRAARADLKITKKEQKKLKKAGVSTKKIEKMKIAAKAERQAAKAVPAPAPAPAPVPAPAPAPKITRPPVVQVAGSTGVGDEVFPAPAPKTGGRKDVITIHADKPKQSAMTLITADKGKFKTSDAKYIANLTNLTTKKVKKLAARQAATTPTVQPTVQPTTMPRGSTGVGNIITDADGTVTDLGGYTPQPAESTIFEEKTEDLKEALTQQPQDDRYSTLQNQLLSALGSTERPTVGGVRSARRLKRQRQLATMGATGTFGRSGLRIRSLNI